MQNHKRKNMFVIIHYNSVIWGPKPWNKLGFEDVLQTDCEIEYVLPQRNDDLAPIVVDANTKILKVVGIDNPSINPKIQKLEGPYWNFYSDYAESYYLPQDRQIDEVKDELKGIVATTRYEKEVNGFVMNVQGQQVTIDTSREGRGIYFDTYLAIGEQESIGWKFPETWLSLTKNDLDMIVFAGKTHIQNCFIWEATKISEIDAATTLTQLDAINLEYGS